MICPACGHENPADHKFCGECGTLLARACPSCGTSNAPTMKFCGECGKALAAEKVDALVGELDALPLGTSSQFLQAQSSRFRAHLAAREGDTPNAERLFKGASGLFRELAFPFYLATTELEYAKWLEGQGRTGELSPIVAETRQIFDQLGARPLLERTERIAGAAPVPA